MLTDNTVCSPPAPPPPPSGQAAREQGGYSQVGGWAGRPGPEFQSTVGLRSKGVSRRATCYEACRRCPSTGQAPFAQCRCSRLHLQVLSGRNGEGHPLAFWPGRTSHFLGRPQVRTKGGVGKGRDRVFKQAPAMLPALCSVLETFISPKPQNKVLQTHTVQRK